MSEEIRVVENESGDEFVEFGAHLRGLAQIKIAIESLKRKLEKENKEKTGGIMDADSRAFLDGILSANENVIIELDDILKLFLSKN